jgi:hypothetical protein
VTGDWWKRWPALSEEKSFNTEDTEEEHRGHREENPKRAA